MQKSTLNWCQIFARNLLTVALRRMLQIKNNIRHQNKLNMKQKIVPPNIKFHFATKNIVIIFSLIITLSFMHSSVFSQAKSDETKKTTNAKDSLNDIIIHQEINFKVAPKRVYETLLSSKEFSACTK